MPNDISTNIIGSGTPPGKPNPAPVTPQPPGNDTPIIRRGWGDRRDFLMLGAGSGLATLVACFLPSCGEKKVAVKDIIDDKNNPLLRRRLLSAINDTTRDGATFIRFHFPGRPNDEFYNNLINSTMNEYNQKTGRNINFEVRNMDLVFFDQDDFIDMRPQVGNSRYTQRLVGNGLWVVGDCPR